MCTSATITMLHIVTRRSPTPPKKKTWPKASLEASQGASIAVVLLQLHSQRPGLEQLHQSKFRDPSSNKVQLRNTVQS